MAGIGRVKGERFQSLREQGDEDERLHMRRMTYLPGRARERQRLMSVDSAIERARQIAAMRRPLTNRGTPAPITGGVTDSLKDLLDAPRSPPFDRIGVVCLAWAAAFITLTAVLALTLK
jgi:hypothetical protein